MMVVQRCSWPAMVLVGFLLKTATSFVLPVATTKAGLPAVNSGTCLFESGNRGGNNAAGKKPYQKNKKKRMTLGDLQKEMLKNSQGSGSKEQNKRKRSRRTRQRVEDPKQRYVYASQRNMAQKGGQRGNGEDADLGAIASANAPSVPILEAKRMGLTNPVNQHCDALVNNVEPEIMGQIRVAGEDEGNSASGAYAYLINKPAGWSILGEKQKTKKKQQRSNDKTSSSVGKINNGGSSKKSSTIKRVKVEGEDLEFDESEIMALLTPEERAMLEAENDSLSGTSTGAFGPNGKSNIPGWYDIESMTPEEREEASIDDEDYDPSDVPDFDEADIIALMTDEEREEYEAEKLEQKTQINKRKKRNKGAVVQSKYESLNESDVDESAVENLKRIKTRLENKKDGSETGSFSSFQRPSVVSWLKDWKAAEGSPIRGGNFWTALAGATEVDDSGLVLLCPKKNTENLIVEYSEYIAVVGNGKFLAPQAKKIAKQIPDDAIQLDMVSRVRKGREGDVCQTVRFVISEHFATCSSVVNRAQMQFEDGIRGDPGANPFDRRAPRRLVHCNSMSVSSLVFDETSEAETPSLPDDIAILSDRLNSHRYQKGSFLGRQSLRDNPLTTAYREINGAADGFPGWTVDRYNDWLFVQHDEQEAEGPLPSIHDGNTAGVYLLPANPDRGAMGSKEKVRPILLEGRAAPETFPILENGVVYHVSLDKDLSTGIFLDQRMNRAWLTRNCNQNTHVLNCFAHCGAFSVAAAKAGASTVSLDLNKKWLNRVEPQLEANGVPFDERHDCIFGDCFEWLEKLSKRGEKFDIVILDPPSSSVGKKKKRWSVNRDMAELVQIAAPLVKKGGLLWTTTNSASLPPIKFATLCQKGFAQANIESKLERIQPMSVDFPSIGAPPVKNLVWRVN
mmetsp:Transcript_8979/g.21884  ORF Transcript_8979/g.21884 Transcript_8979/m.21884 type:complete len:906 (-) Transcript_8979:106-2823(-)